MPDQQVLVIDQGSQSSRALVFDGDLRVVARASCPIATHRLGQGRVEQDPLEILNSVKTVVAGAVSQCDRRPDQAALVTQRSTVLCWDRTTLAPHSQALSWQDTRAPLPNNLDPAVVCEVTGIRASRHAGAPKMQWLLSHVPDLFTSPSMVIGPLAAYLAQCVTGNEQSLIDPSNASRTLLFDYRTRDWHTPLLDTFDIPRRLLPDPKPHRSDYGELDTPLGAVPLVLLNGDQSVVPFACGPVDSESVWIQIGTGGFVQRRATAPVDGMLYSRIWDDGGEHLDVVEGTVNGAGAALDWAMEPLGLTATALPEASKRMGGPELPLFINAVGGLGSPDWRADLTPHWQDQGQPIDRLAAVLESVVFLLMRNLERLPGEMPGRLVVSGGLGRNESLCRGLADLSGVVIERPSEPESSALGAAALLLGGSQGVMQPGERIEPMACDALENRYQRWRETLESLLARQT